MFRFPALFLLFLTVIAGSFPADAQSGGDSCGFWTAGMTQDEEGEVMMASVCVSHGESTGEVSLKCGPDGQLSMNYFSGLQGKVPGDNNPDGYKANFTLTSADRTAVIPMQLYKMYDEIGGYFDAKGDLAKLLIEGREFTISSDDGFYPPETYSLAMADEMIAVLLKHCN